MHNPISHRRPTWRLNDDKAWSFETRWRYETFLTIIAPLFDCSHTLTPLPTLHPLSCILSTLHNLSHIFSHHDCY